MKNWMTSLLIAATILIGTSSQASSFTPMPRTSYIAQGAMSFADTVRQNTDKFQDVQTADDASYALLHSCVSSPTGGATGVHFANGDLVGDGKLDVQRPEALLYEASDGQMRLVGVEYVVLAKEWDANNSTPPVLMGQLFNYNSSPIRYGLPAFYELHVWAWKHNPNGMFSDWNPDVSCEEYAGAALMHETNQ